MSRLFSLPGFALRCLTLAAACAAGYAAIGSHVDADGFVREPFALIPLAFLFFALGATCAATAAIRAQLRRRRRRA
ncbi:DUF3955 domain-containing protein [Lysobacter enzymogenes]|uniref:DUF3955 domain-containing protein n=1 Tax=Lysobacter enzymogenes TaxID=69 RepID=UPI0038500D5A